MQERASLGRIRTEALPVGFQISHEYLGVGSLGKRRLSNLLVMASNLIEIASREMASNIKLQHVFLALSLSLPLFFPNA